MSLATDTQQALWSLWCDFCRAENWDPLRITTPALSRFFASVPCAPSTRLRRVQTLRAVVRALGHRPAVGLVASPTEVAAELERAVIWGWPDAMAGRRNAALVAVVRCFGLTRPQAQALDAHTAKSFLRDPASDPARCPSCAVARWGELYAYLKVAGWRATRELLAERPFTRARQAQGHACSHAWWPDGLGGPLFVPIDRKGQPDMTNSLSVVAISRITQPSRTEPVVAPGPKSVQTSWDRDAALRARRQVARAIEEADRLLEQAEQEVDKVMGRLGDLGLMQPD